MCIRLFVYSISVLKPMNNLLFFQATQKVQAGQSLVSGCRAAIACCVGHPERCATPGCLLVALSRRDLLVLILFGLCGPIDYHMITI